MREVFADKSVEVCLKALPADCQSGLILGHNTPTRTLVVHLAPTPPLTDDVTDGGADNTAALSPAWMAKHAKQVIALLPGGLDVVGVFCVGGADVFKSSESQLRSALTAIYRTLDKLSQLHDSHPHKLLAAVAPTNKVTCRTVELSNLTASLKPAQWNYRDLRWTRVQSQLYLDTTSSVTSLGDDVSMFRQMTASLESGLDRLSSVGEDSECASSGAGGSFCLINGRLADAGELLTSASTAAASCAAAGDGGGGPVQLDILQNMGCREARWPDEGFSEDNTDKNITARFRSSGLVHCEAFVTNKATVGEASAAICVDARRSVYARCRMHCDSLIVQEDESAGDAASSTSAWEQTVVHELPRRVLAPLCPQQSATSCSQLLLTDYLFPGDAPADSLQTLSELFGLEMTAEQVQDTVEVHSDEVASSECSSSAAEALEGLRDLPSRGVVGEPRCSCLYALFAIAVCVLGVMMSSILLIGPNPPTKSSKSSY